MKTRDSGPLWSALRIAASGSICNTLHPNVGVRIPTSPSLAQSILFGRTVAQLSTTGPNLANQSCPKNQNPHKFNPLPYRPNLDTHATCPAAHPLDQAHWKL